MLIQKLKLATWPNMGTIYRSSDKIRVWRTMRKRMEFWKNNLTGIIKNPGLFFFFCFYFVNFFQMSRSTLTLTQQTNRETIQRWWKQTINWITFCLSSICVNKHTSFFFITLTFSGRYFFFYNSSEYYRLSRKFSNFFAILRRRFSFSMYVNHKLIFLPTLHFFSNVGGGFIYKISLREQSMAFLEAEWQVFPDFRYFPLFSLTFEN